MHPQVGCKDDHTVFLVSVRANIYFDIRDHARLTSCHIKLHPKILLHLTMNLTDDQFEPLLTYGALTPGIHSPATLPPTSYTTLIPSQ